MKQAKVLLVALLIGAGVAVVYLLFEESVRWTTERIWDEWLQTETQRVYAFFAAVVLGMVYFWLKHLSEKHHTALNKRPLYNLVAILLVGLASLLAGATLGPEAILMPAALIVGQVIGKHHFPTGYRQLFGAAGIVALFVAFFDALWGGLLGFLFARAMITEKLTPIRYVGLFVAAIGTYTTLHFLTHESTFAVPHGNFLTLVGLGLYALGIIVGMGLHRILAWSVKLTDIVKEQLPKTWYVRGFVASAGLGLLYLAGGYLVQFTGSTAIQPLFEQSAHLGLWTLVWLAVIKMVAIAWSQEMGYRGGAIFPLMFAGSAIAAAASLYTNNFSPLAMALSVLAGAIIADRKLHHIVGNEHHA